HRMAIEPLTTIIKVESWNTGSGSSQSGSTIDRASLHRQLAHQKSIRDLRGVVVAVQHSGGTSEPLPGVAARESKRHVESPYWDWNVV
ncbi:hypothetical protein B0H12DRAFT_1131459, partial [Mycena haematopus]